MCYNYGMESKSTTTTTTTYSLSPVSDSERDEVTVSLVERGVEMAVWTWRRESEAAQVLRRVAEMAAEGRMRDYDVVPRGPRAHALLEAAALDA